MALTKVSYSMIQGAVANVLDFGADPTGVADSTSAIQDAIDSVKTAGGAVYFPTGTYQINDTIIVDTNQYTVGLILFGDGRNTIIAQTGTNKDAFHFSTTQFLQNSGFRDLKITCDADAGHCINIVYGCTTCFVTNVDMEQANPAKSLIYGDYTSFGGGVYDTKFSGGSWYCNPNTTVPGVAFVANGTIFNENIFENLRVYNSKTVQFFYINTTTTPTIWLINNVWRNINFEVCKGGGIYFDCFKNCLFQNLSFWDTGSAYENNLIEMGTGVGYESASNTFINVGRNGDSLAAGVYDIRIVAGQDTTLIDCFTQTGDSPLYNFNNKRVTAIGPLTGTVQNPGGLFRVGSAFGQLQFPGTINGAYLTYYDEGTWTATLDGSSTSPTTPVTATGVWTRIGRQVFVTVEFLNVTTTGATGNVVVTGLPFIAVTRNGYGATSIKGLGANAVVASPTQASTQIDFYLATDRSTNLTFGAGTGQYLAFSATYIA
jgi:hypothetical protein